MTLESTTATIILAHIAAGFAFLVGATYDWSPLFPAFQRLNKLASAATTFTLTMLGIVVVRSAK